MSSRVIPYFQGIRDIMNGNQNKFRVGIYGSRNVCSRVSNRELAVSSFVADMSTGFSGNMGYTIPDNWAFDQFHEYNFISSDGTSFGLDKNGYSGRYVGFGIYVEHADNETWGVIPLKY